MINDAGEQTLSIDEVLETRGNRYGNYADNALVSQTIQRILLQHSQRNGQQMPAYMIETLAYICQKLARLTGGDPFYDDNWVDISGYATLVVNELHKKDPNEQTNS